MASYIRQRPANWFVFAAAALLLWALVGCWNFYRSAVAGYEPAAHGLAGALNAATPAWLTAVYATAVAAALLGAIALLRRSKLAGGLYIVSLGALVVQFGYVFAVTDILAAEGLRTLAVPVAIVAVAAGSVWFADYARRHGWIC